MPAPPLTAGTADECTSAHPREFRRRSRRQCHRGRPRCRWHAHPARPPRPRQKTLAPDSGLGSGVTLRSRADRRRKVSESRFLRTNGCIPRKDRNVPEQNTQASTPACPRPAAPPLETEKAPPPISPPSSTLWAEAIAAARHTNVRNFRVIVFPLRKASGCLVRSRARFRAG